MEHRTDDMLSLCRQLLENCRNELMVLYPHLDAAFAQLAAGAAPGGGSVATDGQQLRFSPRWLMELYSTQPARLRRGWMHMLLHCLYLHPFSRREGDALWDLARDMAVEQQLWLENQPRLMLPPNTLRQRCMEILGDELRPAEVIEEMLRQGLFPDTPDALMREFSFDDHSLWGRGENVPLARKLWLSLGAGAENKRRAGRPGTLPGDIRDILDGVKPQDRDYRSWLRQFTSLREELELDPEHFDPVFYHFGLEQYGNMPLIEPLECKEVARLEELVIAIDTSGSCSRETVQRFLEDTFAILSSRENFFRQMKVYLIQCDCMVQDVQILRSAEDWQRCSRHVTIQGRGGTDFTPVFRYVDKLCRDKELKNLRALLYFTDGEGFYPREKPAYETAFVFTRESEYTEHAPAWAKKLLLGGRRVYQS